VIYRQLNSPYRQLLLKIRNFLLNSLDSFTPCLSVVVPVYNEQETLAKVVKKLLRLSELHEIVIVDDCSSDATPGVANRLAAEHAKIQVVHHSKNLGKTEALKTGFQRTSGSIVIVQDADLEYDPEEIPSLIQPILEGHADVVYGSRFLVRKAARVLYFYHYLGNRALTFLSNLFTNVNLTDVETGYKAFRGEIIREMIIDSKGFGFEIEVTAKVAKLKCAIFEAPISYYGRTYEEGKKIGFRDAVAALWYIARFNIFCSYRASFRNDRIPGVHSLATERLNRVRGPS
jgi:glycosyltransferase involved in cell wall biosynthesis